MDLPDNFYSMVADLHSESKKEAEVDRTAKYTPRLRVLPPTKKLYYDQPSDVEFEAVVLDFFDGYAVLDQTLFYPEGGGQPADTGTLIGSDSMAQVDGVVKVGEVILHHIAGGMLRRGERIKGMVDEGFRNEAAMHPLEKEIPQLPARGKSSTWTNERPCSLYPLIIQFFLNFNEIIPHEHPLSRTSSSRGTLMRIGKKAVERVQISAGAGFDRAGIFVAGHPVTPQRFYSSYRQATSGG